MGVCAKNMQLVFYQLKNEFYVLKYTRSAILYFILFLIKFNF